MEKIIHAVKRILLFFICILTATNAITITLQVIFRFFFKISIAWVSEFSGVSLVWITFLGAALATLNNTNIGFDLLVNKGSPFVAMIMKTIINLLILFVGSILTIHGISTVRSGLSSSMSSLPVSYGFCYSIIPVSGIIIIFAACLHIVDSIRIFRGGFSVVPTDTELFDDIPENVLENAKKRMDSVDERSG